LSFDLSKLCSWFQGISMSSLGKLVYPFSSYKRTYTISISVLCTRLAELYSVFCLFRNHR
jgi:hypothetical protein